ncbi:MAG: hypothetical protein BWY17_04965 [Deltaproteobacteria bacterium ADurb.Bin207]|nr:MAG: hypothetical protein BWY17_04965 [Deltaproteobacteria bacterium ADurb.Bin207]
MGSVPKSPEIDDDTLSHGLDQVQKFTLIEG